MAFGQAAGPPASARRVAELAALFEARGYESFKEARHPFGLTQRQAAGKFTTGEVEELIARLEAEADGDEGGTPEPVVSPAGAGASATGAKSERRRRQEEELVVRLDADVMATELVNRGWCCIPPPD